MRVIILMILIALTAVPALAHEVKPLPQKESCDAAKWLGSLVNATSPREDGYNALRVLQEDASDECERYRQLRNEAVKSAYQKAAEAVTKCE